MIIAMHQCLCAVNNSDTFIKSVKDTTLVTEAVGGRRNKTISNEFTSGTSPMGSTKGTSWGLFYYFH